MDALVSLSAEIGYEEVTVEALLDRADVARATFYAHFDDKDSLLDAVVDGSLEDLAARLAPVLQTHEGGFQEVTMLTIFEHAQESRDLYLVVLRGAGGGRPLRRVMDWGIDISTEAFGQQVRQIGEEPRVPLALIANDFVGSMLGVLRWWLEAGCPSTAAEVTDQWRRLSLLGRGWAMNLDPDSLWID